MSGALFKRIGVVIFSIGVLLAFALTALMVWADVEANSYGFPRVGNGPMSSLLCPQFMNSTESTSFSVTLKNGTSNPLRPRVQAYISAPTLDRWRTDTKAIDIAPGESGTVTWEVGPDDISLGYFVLIKAYTFASYPQEDVEGACGIFVLDVLGISGDMLYWLWLAASLAFLIGGLWLSDYRAGAEESSARGLARKVLAVLAVFGLTAGSMGWWPVGIIILVVLALALPAVLFFGQNN